MPLLGPDAKDLAVEGANRALLRLAATLGSPWGRDEPMMRQMVQDWALVLYGFSQPRVDAAVSDYLLTETRWPAPADIRKRCIGSAQPVASAPRQIERDHRSPEARERVNEIIRIRAKHKGSETEFSDTLNDPEYQALLADYQRRTGWKAA